MTKHSNLEPCEISVYSKLLRGIWNCVWLVFYRLSPRIMHGWRRILLRIFGAKIGKGVAVYPSSKVWAPWNLQMDDYSCLADDVNCYCVAQITIGASTTISQGSWLCSASHDYTTPLMQLVVAPISIGANVWITGDVFVGPGLRIGDGAVVTARSTVLSDVPPWTIATGFPARVVKKREYNID
jgi:putative colanic acid biosynthesis acetyltransferase WcaF